MSTSSAVRAHRKEPSKAVAKLTSATRMPPISTGVGVATKKRGGVGASKRREQDVRTLQTFESTEFIVSNGVHATQLMPGGIDAAAARGFSRPPEPVASAATSLYSPLRSDSQASYPEERGSSDWCAIVSCVDAGVESTISLRLPLAGREPFVDSENAVGLLFALPLECSAWDVPDASGPRINISELASSNLLDSVREARQQGAPTMKRSGPHRGMRTRAGTTLSSTCAQDRIPHCVSIHWGHRALCSLLLPPHEPLLDWGDQFWCLEVANQFGTGVVRLLLSKQHLAPAAVEYFAISSELHALLRSLHTAI